MGEFDRYRIAMVKATPATGNPGIGTGYFLTGDLVLTARHVADVGPDCTFRVRAEVGQSEKDRWSDAEPVWTGESDLDAMLLHAKRSFGSWDLPPFLVDKESGTWKSAGYARAAVDDEKDNRKTLPLAGDFDISGGQGSEELALQTKHNIYEKWNTYWSGISGAPVFSTDSGGDDGLIGIITKASSKLPDWLIGTPAKRLFEDIHFRSAITPSFLGRLPETRFCLVLSSEGSKKDLVKQTAYVLKGFRKEEVFQGLHEVPISVRALEAVRSAENWAATVDAVARADYLIADVTSFEPVVMLLLGVRSVLRRGVTISVTEGQSAELSAALPFNVQETRLLSWGDGNLYNHLYHAMAEGAANLGRDSNYLDLPSYQAVRAPRPESWAEKDNDSLLVLCPFSKGYKGYYEQELRDIIHANTGGRAPLRMVDLRSPRLVGQALYEQVRWSSWCLVDWTEWRPNVFFELGVRLACSGRDPMCIIQQNDAEGKFPITDARLEQQDLLLQLLGPVVYDRENPGEALESALDSWPSPPLPGRLSPSPSALPPAATFKKAQASFQWKGDPMLIRPHLEQRHAAELIFGKNQQKRPERLVLFGYNEQFYAELQAAVREKWIATWLYLRHLSTGDDTSGQDSNPELERIANIVDYLLRSSDTPRHVQLRKEINDFLGPQRTRRRTGESAGTNG